MKTQTHKGIVKWYKQELGFGFLAISPELKRELGIEPDKDLFIHAGGLAAPQPKTLLLGDCVEFKIQIGTKGPRAVNCRVVSHTPEPPLENLRD